MEKDKELYIPALRYDWLTPLYDPIVRLTTRETVFKTALLEQADIREGQRVLDLACGTATLTIAAKKSCPQAEVIGIDGDPAILEQARAKARRAGVGIGFDEGLSYQLPYVDGYFDRVLSSLFFHHLTRENKLQTLVEIRRVLKPGGEFHVADWGAPSNWLMKRASYFIQLLDGVETTKDSFNGLLPVFMNESGFIGVRDTKHYNSLFGTIRLHMAKS